MKSLLGKNMLSALMLTAAIALVTPSCKPKDADIQVKVTEAVKSMPGVTVAVDKGVATLSGQVPTDADKAAAETAAKGIKGVETVVNNLTVPPPPAPVVIAADDPLATSVKAALAAYSTVMADVKDGVVTLTGEIKKTELPKIMQALQALKPKKVENKLIIK